MRQKATKQYISTENVSKPIFENKWLDSLTRTHISIPVTLFFLYAVGLLYYTKIATGLGNLEIVLLFFGGFLFFTFVEYCVHRWGYHPPENASEKHRRITYVIHGVHHDYPKDKRRLAMPPIVTVVIGTVLLFLFQLILNDYSFSFLAGFFSGYAFYLLIHYVVHIFRAPRNFMRALWINHNLHHYSKDGVLFGVSSPLWDHVFGTVPEKRKFGNKNVEVRID